MLKHKLVDFIIQFMEEVDKEISEMKLFVCLLPRFNWWKWFGNVADKSTVERESAFCSRELLDTSKEKEWSFRMSRLIGCHSLTERYNMMLHTAYLAGLRMAWCSHWHSRGWEGYSGGQSFSCIAREHDSLQQAKYRPCSNWNRMTLFSPLSSRDSTHLQSAKAIIHDLY